MDKKIFGFHIEFILIFINSRESPGGPCEHGHSPMHFSIIFACCSSLSWAGEFPFGWGTGSALKSQPIACNTITIETGSIVQFSSVLFFTWSGNLALVPQILTTDEWNSTDDSLRHCSTAIASKVSTTSWSQNTTWVHACSSHSTNWTADAELLNSTPRIWQPTNCIQTRLDANKSLKACHYGIEFD